MNILDVMNLGIYIVGCLTIVATGMVAASVAASCLLAKRHPEGTIEVRDDFDSPYREMTDEDIIQEIDQATTDMFDENETESHRWSASVTRQALNNTLGIRQRERAN
jgi:hypothetical protein